MTKAESRRQFLSLRKSLHTDEVEVRSQQICQRLFEQEWVKTKATVHTFLPILRQKEINTWPIIHRLWTNFPQTRVAVSVTDAEAYLLTHYELTSNTVLIESRWGIPEPVAESASLIDTKEVDLVLVPLLIFDQHGHRVGYGGGFYDRFLSNCRTDCLKVGLSLFEPIESVDDIIATDIPLDNVLTPERVYFFN